MKIEFGALCKRVTYAGNQSTLQMHEFVFVSGYFEFFGEIVSEFFSETDVGGGLVEGVYMLPTTIFTGAEEPTTRYFAENRIFYFSSEARKCYLLDKDSYKKFSEI